MNGKHMDEDVEEPKQIFEDNIERQGDMNMDDTNASTSFFFE